MKLATNQGLNGRSGLDDGEMYGAETLDLLTRRFTHTYRLVELGLGLSLISRADRIVNIYIWRRVISIRQIRSCAFFV